MDRHSGKNSDNRYGIIMETKTQKPFVVTRQTSEGKRYVAHQGHEHYWTNSLHLAMEYTKLEVAQGMAIKMGGKVELL